jgi:hypothetical protein
MGLANLIDGKYGTGVIDTDLQHEGRRIVKVLQLSTERS